MKNVRVLIVGDHRLFCDGLKAVLETHRGIRVIGMVTDMTKAEQEAINLHPDVIILDTTCPPPLLERFLGLSSGDTVLVHLSPEHNRVTVYHAEWIDNATANDLIGVIRPFPTSKT